MHLLVSEVAVMHPLEVADGIAGALTSLVNWHFF
jgi:hypothetical protein